MDGDEYNRTWRVAFHLLYDFNKLIAPNRLTDGLAD